jgi:hypothetical protein
VLTVTILPSATSIASTTRDALGRTTATGPSVAASHTRAVGRGDDQVLARAVAGLGDGVRVPPQDARLDAVVGAMDAGGSVAAPRQEQLAVGAEGDASDVRQRSDRPSAAAVPDARDGVLVEGRDKPPVAAERSLQDGCVRGRRLARRLRRYRRRAGSAVTAAVTREPPSG